MEKYIPVLMKTRLFSGLGEEDIRAMLTCLQARLGTYKKGEYVLRQGERTEDIMVLAEGQLHIQRDDYWGNRSIINAVSPGDMFGEAYAAPESGPVQSDVLAVEDSAVIFFDVKRVITVCPSACRFHSIAVQNLFLQYPKRTESLYASWELCQGAPPVKSLSHIFPRKRKVKEAALFPYPSTVSSLRIFSRWTEAQCPMSFAE